MIIGIISFSGRQIAGRKVEPTAHVRAMVILFTPRISFNRGRFLENFTLYKVPENRGKRRMGSVRTFTENARSNESMKEKINENLKTGSIFLISFALSGALIVSSFKSVNLFNPYMLKVTKKVARTIFKPNVLNNKQENSTLREPFIAKKKDVDIRNDVNLFRESFTSVIAVHWHKCTCRDIPTGNFLSHISLFLFDTAQTVQHPNKLLSHHY